MSILIIVVSIVVAVAIRDAMQELRWKSQLPLIVQCRRCGDVLGRQPQGFERCRCGSVAVDVGFRTRIIGHPEYYEEIK
jgi:hypothetical protein